MLLLHVDYNFYEPLLHFQYDFSCGNYFLDMEKHNRFCKYSTSWKHLGSAMKNHNVI